METLSIDTLLIHRLANEHRTMTELEFEALKLDIQDNGQLIPVILYKGKVVDGRHRMRALQELGEDSIKIDNLPGNMSLAEVKKRVLGTEIRRADNVMQKAIRGYKAYSGGTMTQAEASVKVGVAQDQISRAKKVHEKLGAEFLDSLYQMGYATLGNRRLTQLRDILKYYEVKPADDREYEPPTEELAKVYIMLKTMSVEELLLLANRGKTLATKLSE